MSEYDQKVDLDQVLAFKFCPYCGEEGVAVYTGDFHSYTVCLECEDELELFLINWRGR